MAAQQNVETMSNKGEEEPMPDIMSWLKQSRLDKNEEFTKYFVDNDVIISDLLSYNEAYLDAITNDVKSMSIVYKRRFQDAVRKLQLKYSKDVDVAPHSGQIYRVIISNKESASMDILNKKLTEIEVSLQDNTKYTSKLLQDTPKKEADIESEFAVFKKALDDRQKVLKRELNEESNEQLKVLKVQKENLQKYKENIIEATKEQNGLILDPNMDKKKREIKIEGITMNIINGINADDLKVNESLIQFNVDQIAVNKFIGAIGDVSGKPKAPILSVSDIGVNKVKVTCSSGFNHGLVEYQVRYKRNGNDENDDDDEKKGDWNEVNFDKNQNKRILTDLIAQSQYKIEGRYKILSRSVWSRYSEMKLFETLQPKAPKLKVSDIGVNKVKVSCSSGFNHDLVEYQVRYRRNGGDEDDDDEKKGGWNEVQFDMNQNKKILDGLSIGSQYEIEGRYKILSGLIWSKYSEMKLFKTLISVFEWDANKKHQDITISNNNLTISHTSGSWGSIVAKNLLSGSNVSSVEWEITLNKIPQSTTYFYLMMGYIADGHTANYGTNLGENEHEVCLDLNSNDKFYKYHKGSETNPWNDKWNGSICKIGDRIKLIFDFNKKTCTVYYNDECVGLLMDNIPNKLYPAMSVLNEHESTCTKWIVHSK